jgi:hypothetical protein
MKLFPNSPFFCEQHLIRRKIDAFRDCLIYGMGDGHPAKALLSNGVLY